MNDEAGDRDRRLKSLVLVIITTVQLVALRFPALLGCEDAVVCKTLVFS